MWKWIAGALIALALAGIAAVYGMRREEEEEIAWLARAELELWLGARQEGDLWEIVAEAQPRTEIVCQLGPYQSDLPAQFGAAGAILARFGALPVGEMAGLLVLLEGDGTLIDYATLPRGGGPVRLEPFGIDGGDGAICGSREQVEIVASPDEGFVAIWTRERRPAAE